MSQFPFLRDYRVPILSYLFLILIIFILRTFLDSGIVFSISAVLMLLIPFLLNKDRNYFYFNIKGFVKGVLISLAVLSLYLIVLLAYGLITGKQPGFREVGYSFFYNSARSCCNSRRSFFQGLFADGIR